LLSKYAPTIRNAPKKTSNTTPNLSFLSPNNTSTFRTTLNINSSIFDIQSEEDIETVKPTPKKVFHGTSRENARAIYKTELWLIGKVTPRAIYLTTNFEIAQSYAGKKGAIVEISVGRGANLQKFTKYHKEGVYIFEIPDGKPDKEYYRIKGLKPVRILNYKGKKIE